MSMPTSAAEDPRLARVSAICAELPEADRERSGRHAVFRVRGRTFAYYQDDHHGDGRVALICRAPGGENEALIAGAPGRYFMPAYIGGRGWVALALDVPDVDWEEAAGLLTDSYLLAAPKRLASRVAGARQPPPDA